MQVTHFLSPIGMVQITEERECITQIRFADGEVIPLPYSSAVLDECRDCFAPGKNDNHVWNE